MNVVIDGFVYQFQAYRGISRIYNEILPRMCKIDSSLHVTLLTSGRCQQPLPTHPQLEHKSLLPVEQLLRPNRLWWRIIPHLTMLMQQLYLGSGKGSIWHSTYYTVLNQWKGPRVVTVYDMIHELFAHVFTGAKRERALSARKHRSILAADMVICISETTKRNLQQIYNLDDARIKVIPLAHSCSFRILKDGDLSYRLPTEKPFLLYIGHRTYYKNFKIVLQAYNYWSKAKDIALIVVGGPWLEEEKQQLVDLGVADYIHLLTDVDDQHLCFLYNQAIGFVYPSLYEGFGLPLLEAMACGCPIVASNIPAAREVAGDCPIYFEPAEVESLLAAFEMVLSEKHDSARVKLGLEWVKQYSWDETARQTLDVYRALGV